MRETFGYWATVPTRWNDNDVYGHVNNTVYYAAMDTVINAWMIEHAGLDIHAGPAIGLCVESSCRYLAPAEYPDVLEVGLRIARLGRTSVTWESALLRQRDDQRLAEGRFVHVFVDRGTRKPRQLAAEMRTALSALTVSQDRVEGSGCKC